MRREVDTICTTASCMLGLAVQLPAILRLSPQLPRDISLTIGSGREKRNTHAREATKKGSRHLLLATQKQAFLVGGVRLPEGCAGQGG